MGKKKTADQFYEKSKERGATQARSGINGDVVHKDLGPREQRAIERMEELWDR